MNVRTEEIKMTKVVLELDIHEAVMLSAIADAILWHESGVVGEFAEGLYNDLPINNNYTEFLKLRKSIVFNNLRLDGDDGERW